jgi:hypothetical protein
MKETRITLPELALVAGTRVALGAGLGLLLAERLSDGERRAAGWTLFLIGALSTVPLAFEVLGGNRLTGQPHGGDGRVDVTGIMLEGIRIDPNLTEGHPGYEESGDSEIIPAERFVKSAAAD